MQSIAGAQVEYPLRSVPGQERQHYDIYLEPAQGAEAPGFRLPGMRPDRI